jgi:hypothetical protein
VGQDVVTDLYLFFLKVGIKLLQILHRIDRQFFFLRVGTQLLHVLRQNVIVMGLLGPFVRIRNHICEQLFLNKFHQLSDQLPMVLVNEINFSLSQVSVLS